MSMKFQEDIFNGFHFKHRHDFVTELLLTKFKGEWLNEKKDNKQCLSDTPRWSMKKTNIKNTKAIQNG